MYRWAAGALAPAGKSISFSVSKTCDNIQADHGECLMAKTKTVFDEIDEEAEKRTIAKARAEIVAGKGVPHEKVRECLIKLRDGKVEPPPCA
jgi:hypothetical protein